MFAAAICVSILLGVLVWALPGRLCDRRATHADVLAGPGIVLAVWIIAACVFAQPGLAQGGLFARTARMQSAEGEGEAE